MADPQLTVTWWDKNRPKTLPSTGLGKVLKQYEAALKSFEKEAVKNPPSPDVMDSFVGVKTALANVATGAKTARNKCNKTLHKDGIASLDKIAVTVLPKERKRLDDIYHVWELKRQDVLKKAMDARLAAYKALETEAGVIAKGVRDLQQTAASIDKGASIISQAVIAHDAERAKKALAVVQQGRDNVVSRVALFRKKAAAAQKAPWPPVDRKLLNPKELTALSQLADKRSNVIAGVERADEMLKDLEVDVKKTVAEAEHAASGGESTDRLVIADLNRLLNRMKKAAEELNALTRDCTASVGNFWAALDEYGKAQTEEARAKHKDSATKARLGTKQTLEGGKPLIANIVADMERTLKSQPRGILDNEAEPFKSLAAEIKKFNGYLKEYKKDLDETQRKFDKNEEQYQKIA